MTTSETDLAAGASVLIVDDDGLTRLLVRRALEQMAVGTVLEAGDGEEAQPLLAQYAVDVVITDLLMPRVDGLALMRWAAEHAPGPRWIILSGVDTFDAAVEAVRLGAYEFLTKPPHVGQLQIALRNALAQSQLVRERERLVGELELSQRTLLAKVRELEERSAAVQRDLRRAEVIQRVLLPSRPPQLEGLSLQTVYRPGRYVGGDLYNVLRLDDRNVALYVADATGHGVSSAMLSVLFHRRLNLSDEHTGAPLAPAEVLAGVNQSICAERIAPGLFLTAAYCLLDTGTGHARLALAGHPPALLHRPDEGVQRFLRSGPALGLTDDAVYRDEAFQLRAGDRLLLYTDGLLDGEHSGAAGTSWLESELGRGEIDPRAVVDRLADSARRAQSAEGEDPDDMTLLLLEARSGPSRFDNGDAAHDARASPAAAASGVQVLFYGESAEHSFFALRGRGTWLCADAFHETAGGILEEGRSVILDLAAADYLDSTFLGTIHELTQAAPARRGRFRLQNANEQLRALFSELDMQRVFSCILPQPLTLPDMRPLVPATEPHGSRARILRAHEQLAALSARNREKFLGVMETMRAQLEGEQADPLDT